VVVLGHRRARMNGSRYSERLAMMRPRGYRLSLCTNNCHGS
jgi:acetyl-CoA carboxylase alpha subunit